MSRPVPASFAAGVILSMAILMGIALAQPPAAQPAFEVVSIRSADLPTFETMRSGQFRTGTTLSEGLADFEFVTLADLLPYAYRVKSFQVFGPQSLHESRWNIRGKIPQGSSQDQVPEMVQAMLVDRFKLAVHHEKRDVPVYELVVLKGALKLEPAEPSDATSANATAATPGPPGFFPPFGGPPGGGPPGGGQGRGPGDGPPDGRGGGPGRGMVIGNANGTVRMSPDENCGMRLEFTQLTMASLADTLTPFLDRPVIDGTGVTGTYKASLQLPMDVMFSMIQNQIRNGGLPPPPGGGPGGPGGPGGGPGGFGPGGGPDGGRGPGGPGCEAPPPNANGSDNSNAAIFQALQRLGLKLQARKAPFDAIVVDHFEKTPSEN